MKSFINEIKAVCIKYYVKIKARWIGFVTDVKIMIGIKPKPKKRGRPPKVKKNGKGSKT
tara:strand:+ start:585 stop:761 length:177 start_codon:yes stop_codon:yes gene_type:complete